MAEVQMPVGARREAEDKRGGSRHGAFFAASASCITPCMARIIETLDDIADGLAALAVADPRLSAAHRLAGDPPLRRAEGGFPGLVQIVVAQQVSVASAAAIFARTSAVFDPLTPERILAAPDEDFRHAGLSGPKIRAIRAIAAAVES